MKPIFPTRIGEAFRALLGLKGAGITESLNRVYAKVEQTPDPFLEALQRATLMRDPW